MNYYQEIRLLPDAESGLGFIWQKVFQQVHIALVSQKVGEHDSAIGVSFPKYVSPDEGIRTFPLGDTLRVFAESEQELVDLNVEQALIRLEDYAQVKSIKPVPEHSQYACFTRKTVKGENRILAKALQMAEYKARETGESVEKWFKHYRQQSAKLSSALPFIQVSRSPNEQAKAKHSFKLFVEMQLLDSPKSGQFTCYGLSHRGEGKQAMVPWF